MSKQSKSRGTPPYCFACRSERISIAVAPITGRYDLRTLECPNCLSIVRLVELRRSRLPCDRKR